MSHAVRARLPFGALAVLLLVPFGARGAECQDCLGLGSGKAETGWINLIVRRSEPVRVTVTEQVGDAQQPIAELAGGMSEVVVRHADIWRCDRRDRRFVATATFADGATQTVAQTIRTRSCAKRLALAAGVSTRAGSRHVAVRVTDRWGVGDVPVRACAAAPGQNLACRSARIPRGRKQARLSYMAATRGLWSVALQTAWGQTATDNVYVRPAGRLRLLATGDSMIEYVDAALKERLAGRRVQVRSDARVSTGLSKPFLLDWPRLAKHQAATVRPDVTVVFIGANDGFPFGRARCCGDSWVDAYATRAAEMVDAYSRGRRALVYWLTLPAPRPAEWRLVYPAVNRALKRAAAASGGRARVIDIAKVFTPGNRFRSTIMWDGRRQTVRQDDGIHLSRAGASIAEVLIQRTLRRDGVIR